MIQSVLFFGNNAGHPLASPFGRGVSSNELTERAVGEGMRKLPIPKDNKLLDNAKRLRKEMTPQERRLWYQFLRSYPVKVYKQRIIGEYIVDFYCAPAKLVIEIDGSQHFEDKGIVYDQKRTRYLESLGLLVVRYSNGDINRYFQEVCASIHHNIQKRMV